MSLSRITLFIAHAVAMLALPSSSSQDVHLFYGIS